VLALQSCTTSERSSTLKSVGTTINATVNGQYMSIAALAAIEAGTMLGSDCYYSILDAKVESRGLCRIVVV
jgi:hypothetical protein